MANYIEEWAAVLRKAGCNTCVLDGWSLAMPMWYDYVISNCRFDLVLDCNGNLIPHGVPGNLPPETIYGTYFNDHPGGVKRLKEVNEKTIVFCCDNRFCDYTDQYFPMVKHKEFVPLSGSFYPEYVPYEERTTDIIFTGSYHEPEAYRTQIIAEVKRAGGESEFVEDIMEDIIVNAQYTLPECLSRVLRKHNRNMSDDEFREFVRKNILIDYYARFYYRDKIMRSLLDAGLKVHVYGAGWEKLYPEYNKNLVINKGGYYAARKALASSKFALNVMPWFKEGFQERIASAMLSGVIAVTDESTYIRQEFEDGKDMLVYSLKDPEPLPGRMEYLLSHPKEAAEIAENGYQKGQNHTWSARVHDMMEKIEEEFGISLSSEGEGRELELELEFPDKRTAVLEAIYQLQKMVNLTENDVAAIDSLSATDLEFLLQKFEKFVRQFSGRLDGMKMSDSVRNCICNQNREISKETLYLFSLQCKALIGRLLLEEEGLKI